MRKKSENERGENENMSEKEMYESIEEIVDEYIQEGMNLKEICQEVYDSFKTTED